MSALQKLDFMGARKPLGVISIILVVASVVLMMTKGLNLGLDFTGGTVIEVRAEEGVDLEKARTSLVGTPFEGAVLQYFGSDKDMIIRVAPKSDAELEIKPDEVGHMVFDLLVQDQPTLENRRVEFVGPQVGDELRDQSGLAMLIALIAMLIYVWFRFTNKFGISAVAALFHDVLIVLGAFSLFQWEVDLTVLAALLALIGYSINDSIVIADYVRDTFRTTRKNNPEEVVNDAILKTLGRTINTAVTTFLVLVALFVFGGEAVKSFSEALLIGVVVGTYSSIYIVCNLALSMNLNKEDFMLPQPEEVDGMP